MIRMGENLPRLGWLAVFDYRYVFTPVTVAWNRYQVGHEFLEWHTLYVFGVRVARWRVNTG